MTKGSGKSRGGESYVLSSRRNYVLAKENKLLNCAIFRKTQQEYDVTVNKNYFKLQIVCLL